MVHRKTEYRLQFHVLSNDLRKQIWQENIRFRELRRTVNQAHHFWDYQLVDKCDCDNEDVDNEKETADFGKKDESVTVAPINNTGNVHEISIAEKRWKTEAADDERTYKDTGMQTAALQDLVLLDKATETKKPNCSHTMLSGTERRQSKSKMRPKKPDAAQTRLCSASPKVSETAKTAKELEISDLHHNASKDVRQLRPKSVCSQGVSDRNATALPCRRSRSPSPRYSFLSQTTRQSHNQQKQSKFTAFGWNDSHRNIGDKKTYNILAPEAEVHPLALQALRTRQNEIEEYLALEHWTLNSASSKRSMINHSSNWITEYKEKYSSHLNVKKPIHRPMSAPPRRSVTWAVS